MRIQVTHGRHWDWIPTSQDVVAQDGEEVRMMHPDHPTAMMVRRMFDSKTGQITVLEVDEHQMKQMARTYAQAKYGSDKVLRQHLHEVMAKHVSDIMQNHAPANEWLTLKCPDDPKLERYLQQQLIPEEEVA